MLNSCPLRVAAIDFLNPAPLMWDFEHPPLATELAQHYQLTYTQPSQCAANLLSGGADLGLIPIAALTPDLAIVPGCVIASRDEVRSIQLIVKLNGKRNDKRNGHADDDVLRAVRTIAADTASRSSLAYTQVLFRKFLGAQPSFLPAPADPIAMLRSADAALLIGDPALLALEARNHIEQQVGPCLWIDIAHQWHTRTGLPWVAAVWAVRPESLTAETRSPERLIEDLNRSRDRGLNHIDDLVREWTPRIALAPTAIHSYLTENIHYILDPGCLETIQLFRRYAAEIDALPPLPVPRFL
ncbi:MAG TPA: menaquinone biosynthesis protein [Granulicella sp.]|nr:menaquinone biosynthesis protein [Granulicella sp.]